MPFVITVRAVVLAALLSASGLAPTSATASVSPAAVPTPGPCVQGVLPYGALSLICVPSAGWNGDLVVWAHGYVAFNEPLAIQQLELPGRTFLPDLVQGLGYAFATTSYRQNGLAILEGVDDIKNLIAKFQQDVSQPGRTLMLGASEGGIVTTLLIERNPQLFSGGLSACGPIGSFREQIEYIGDTRVLFGYFFPGVIPGDRSVTVPDEVIRNWGGVYVQRVKWALATNPARAAEFVRVARLPIDPAKPFVEAAAQSAERVLWYYVFGTNDASAKLGGNPYGNRAKWYRGSSNDLRLNAAVPRFAADPAAALNVRRYETTGNITRPLITLHTTGDEIIPYWHQLLYVSKARPTGAGRLTPLPVRRYGHCDFTPGELLFSFRLLVEQVTGAQAAGSFQLVGRAQARGVLAEVQADPSRRGPVD